MAKTRETNKLLVTIVAVILPLVIIAGEGCRLPGSEEVEPSPEEIGEAPSLPPEAPSLPPEAPSLPPEVEANDGDEPTLKVFVAEDNQVVEMAFEEYIAGVVAGEMDPSWPMEALAAQAIIARTFTLQKINEKGGLPERGAHASTDIEEFQAYSAEDVTDDVRKAVELTRGEVAIKDNEFIRAWFSAFAGEKTALADEGLGFEEGNPPYIHTVETPGAKIIPEDEGSWEQIFTFEKIRQAVTEQTGEDPGEVLSMEIADKGPSGRTTMLKINDEKVQAPAFRLALGSTEMRSTLLDEVKIEGEGVKLSGRGYGHGVGMCQWGARAMAENGNSAKDIVNYFYNDVSIVKMWG